MYKTRPLVVPSCSNKQFILVGQLLPVFMRNLMLTSWRHTVCECLPAPLKSILHIHSGIFTPKIGKIICYWYVDSYLQGTEQKFDHSNFVFWLCSNPPVGQGFFIIEDSRLHSDTPHSCYNKNYQQMRHFVLCLYFLFSRLFPTCFGPSWAHHQGYFKLLLLCYHLVHAVLCWSSACVRGLVCGGDFGVLVS